MHVLYFHQHFSTPKGAAGIRSYQMAQALVREGHQVTMVCGSYGLGSTGIDTPFKNGSRTGVVDGIRVVEYELAYSNRDGFVQRAILFLKFALRSLKLALTEDFDVAFATTTPLTAGIPGIAARWLRGKKFVFEVRDLWPELPRAMGAITNPLVLVLMSVLEWVSYRSAHRCVALSPGIKEGIARLGVPSDRIELVPNGCDLEIFSELKVERWRPAEVAPDDLMAIFSGTHGLANGLDAVLDAAKVLKARRRTDIKLVLVGDGKLKRTLKERAQNEKLTAVVFLDAVPKAQLAGLLASADVGMQILANVPAFYYGTSPNKFFDYLAASKPVLTNYPGWVADLITEADCGFAVNPENASAFADALEAAAADRNKLRLMGENAGKLARSHFNRNSLAKDWVAWVTFQR